MRTLVTSFRLNRISFTVNHGMMLPSGFSTVFGSGNDSVTKVVRSVLARSGPYRSRPTNWLGAPIHNVLRPSDGGQTERQLVAVDLQPERLVRPRAGRGWDVGHVEAQLDLLATALSRRQPAQPRAERPAAQRQQARVVLPDAQPDQIVR